MAGDTQTSVTETGKEIAGESSPPSTTESEMEAPAFSPPSLSQILLDWNESYRDTNVNDGNASQPQHPCEEERWSAFQRVLSNLSLVLMSVDANDDRSCNPEDNPEPSYRAELEGFHDEMRSHVSTFPRNRPPKESRPSPRDANNKEMESGLLLLGLILYRQDETGTNRRLEIAPHLIWNALKECDCNLALEGDGDGIEDRTRWNMLFLTIMGVSLLSSAERTERDLMTGEKIRWKRLRAILDESILFCFKMVRRREELDLSTASARDVSWMLLKCVQSHVMPSAHSLLVLFANNATSLSEEMVDASIDNVIGLISHLFYHLGGSDNLCHPNGETSGGLLSHEFGLWMIRFLDVQDVALDRMLLAPSNSNDQESIGDSVSRNAVGISLFVHSLLSNRVVAGSSEAHPCLLPVLYTNARLLRMLLPHAITLLNNNLISYGISLLQMVMKIIPSLAETAKRSSTTTDEIRIQMMIRQTVSLLSQNTVNMSCEMEQRKKIPFALQCLLTRYCTFEEIYEIMSALLPTQEHSVGLAILLDVWRRIGIAGTARGIRGNKCSVWNAVGFLLEEMKACQVIVIPENGSGADAASLVPNTEHIPTLLERQEVHTSLAKLIHYFYTKGIMDTDCDGALTNELDRIWVILSGFQCQLKSLLEFWDGQTLQKKSEDLDVQCIPQDYFRLYILVDALEEVLSVRS